MTPTPSHRRSVDRAARASTGVFLLALIVAGIASLGASPAPAKAAALPSLRVHAGGRYLETTDGRPFFWLGDTAWKLMQSTTPDECSYFLSTRARQGFTVIQAVALAEDESILKPNALGQLAFIDQDPARPNDAFFDRVVAVVDEAAAHGLYVALLPTWGDKLTAPWGTGPRVFRHDNLPVVRAFGRYLGQRLRGRTHLVWMLGGDRPAVLDPKRPDAWPQNQARASGFPSDQDWRPIWREMAAGIAEGTGTPPLFLYHPQGGDFSTTQMLPDEPWLAVHGFQSGHGGGRDVAVWDLVARDARLSPNRPTLDLEPNYEDHPYNPWPKWDPASGYFRDHDVRKQCYRSVFAGACGVTYGHHSVWQFASQRNGVINFPEMDWVQALHRPGAVQMQHLRRLIESRPSLHRLRDPSLVIDPPKAGALHPEAMRDRDATYLMVYFPTQDQVLTLDLAVLGTGPLQGWWYDPRTGFAKSIDRLAGGTRQDFRSPSHGPDWVLVLDRADRGYGPPGLRRFEGEPDKR
ncbi:MAG TPA: DUF4038 domain-containing protein [Opitutaceae bacterium]|nr:DUF4038 domain-containing protein [Opitutaceae bacterium]